MASQYLVITEKGDRMVEQLHREAVELEVICMSAPNIWDAETIDDNNHAKRGCNGYPPSKNSYGAPPCPLRKLCLETALEINALHGVWGGKSVYERRTEAKRREKSAKEKTHHD